MGRMGGLASVESKREQKQLVEQLREALYLPVKDEAFANKLVNEGYLSKRMSMRIHYYLCENVRNESSLVVNEELPF